MNAQSPIDHGVASRSTRLGEILAPAQIDDVANALLVLTRELWIAKDRQRVLESLLTEAGVLAPGAVADHQPKGQLAAELETERMRYTKSILSVLCPDLSE
jgi:hypothetical protein